MNLATCKQYKKFICDSGFHLKNMSLFQGEVLKDNTICFSITDTSSGYAVLHILLNSKLKSMLSLSVHKLKYIIHELGQEIVKIIASKRINISFNNK